MDPTQTCCPTSSKHDWKIKGEEGGRGGREEGGRRRERRKRRERGGRKRRERGGRERGGREKEGEEEEEGRGGWEKAVRGGRVTVLSIAFQRPLKAS